MRLITHFAVAVTAQRFTLRSSATFATRHGKTVVISSCAAVGIAFVFTHCQSTVAPELGRFFETFALASLCPNSCKVFDSWLRLDWKEFDRSVVALLKAHHD